VRFGSLSRQFLCAARGILRPAAFAFPAFCFATTLLSAEAGAETRTLKLYFLHTGEKAEIAYKKDGKYIDAGLKRINHFLRDWRRNEPTKMDPRLIDLIWEVYQKSGSTNYVHVVSGYRAPATNNMLRKRGRGVAKFSQHTLGKALDFFLPDVKLAKLREVGLKMETGGVGFYPTSGSPFVHLDTGNIRHWPRMSRQELARVFPDGKTLHIPADGKPLPGYEQAVASFDARRSGKALKAVEIAKAAPDAKKLNVFQRWAAAFKQDQQDDEEANSLPGVNAVKTSEEPAEIASQASGGQALPGVEIGAAGPGAPSARIGKSDSVGTKAPNFEVAAAILPIPAISPKRLSGAGDALALVAANPGARSDQAFAAVDRAGANEKLRNKLAEGSFSVAALSADDIENMRRNAVPVTRSQGSVQDRLASGLFPPEPVGNGEDRQIRERSVQVDSEIILARLNSSEQSASAGDDASGALGQINIVPKKNPARRPPAAAGNRTLELALAPSEGNLNAAADAIRALIEANGLPTGSIGVERTVNDASDQASNRGGIDIGDWALADRDLYLTGEFRAPAFGMGAFRPSPAVVLKAGFETDTQRVVTGTFASSADWQTDFVRLARR